MFERYTERAREVVILAQDEARSLKHNYIGPEHLLAGLIREETGLASRVLESFEVELEDLRAWLSERIGEEDEALEGQIPFTPRAKKIIELGLGEALSLGHNYIGTEHMLLGLMRETSKATEFLTEKGISGAKVRNEILRMLSEEPKAPVNLDDALLILGQAELSLKRVKLALLRMRGES